MAHIPSKELIESTHSFPGIYVFKVIGLGATSFEQEVVKVFAAELSLPRASHSKRVSKDGKHVAITLEIPVGSAVKVIEIYHKLIKLPHLTMLL